MFPGDMPPPGPANGQGHPRAGGRRAGDRDRLASLARVGCRIIEFPQVTNPQGNLTFVEGHRHLPFEVRRVFYLYDVPGGEFRGGHAHRALEQVIIAAASSFDVIVDDGTDIGRFSLNRSYYGLYVPPMVWHELDNFSSGSVALSLASHRYDESDYFRDYEDFLAAARQPQPGTRG